MACIRLDVLTLRYYVTMEFKLLSCTSSELNTLRVVTLYAGCIVSVIGLSLFTRGKYTSSAATEMRLTYYIHDTFPTANYNIQHE